MRYRLQTKLSVTFALIVLVTVGLIALLSRYFIDKQFISYVNSINEDRMDNVVYNLEHQFHVSEGWDPVKIDVISEEALKSGLVLSVRDHSGNEVWNTEEKTHKTCEQLLTGIKNNMKSRYRWWNGKIIESKFPVHHGMVAVGTVTLKYYNPFYFTDKDLTFINVLSQIFGGVMVVAIILAILLGVWISRQISVPICNTVKLTKEISRGNVSSRVDVKSNTVEIRELAEATNLLAEKLGEQETMRKRIVSDVSHELRTPLAAIQNYIEALIDGVWAPSKDRLEKIHKEILRINRLVGDLSKLSRYENNTDKLDISIVDFHEMIAGIVAEFESEGKKRNISIKVKNDVKYIYADEDKLSQVIVNILSNSVKYSEDNGSIHVDAHEDKSGVTITIRDEGIGIPEESLPYIFDRFYRVDSSRSTETGGAGIGLTIAKAIVEAHKGQIKVKSKVGVGTVFIITLPRVILM